MRIYSALQIGAYHTNHCEDYLLISEIGDSKILCAVMDGCTMATDSYFASTLIGKLLRKIAKEQGYKDLYEPNRCGNMDEYLKAIIKELFIELRITKNQLMLDERELLTTLLLMLFDKQSGQGIVLIVGDGLVSIDGTISEFEQDNKPDYLGYHLSKNFEKWYDSQKQKLTFSNATDLSIATDGIFTFTPSQTHGFTESINPVSFLVTDNANSESSEMLNSKLRKLERVYSLKPTDDFSMIRIIM